jgi:hypothetical protein
VAADRFDVTSTTAPSFQALGSPLTRQHARRGRNFISSLRTLSTRTRLL